jgi:hydrogenase maturation protein HypF
MDLKQQISFEGQAAMELEFCADYSVTAAYPWDVREGMPCVIDWEPMIRAIQQDVRHQKPLGIIAAQFHNTLAAIIVEMAMQFHETKVVLTGGCFQNRFLTERTVRLLDEEGIQAFWHQRVPPNDGGIALGQVVAATRAGQHAPALKEAFVS